MKGALVAPLVAGIASLLGATAFAGGEDPHGFLSDRGKCLHCHVEVPAEGREDLPLRKDIVSLCLDCHKEKELTSLHPVDIGGGIQVPEDLPLDAHGTITCGTCHDPHGVYEAERPYVAESLSNRIFALIAGKKSFRTSYLRRPNDQGQLCLACHDRSLLASDGFHVREASLLDQYAGSATCETCHARKFREWERTSHARMARDPKRDPAALTADFSVSPPFPADEVLYVLGNHWTQRFVVAKGDKLYVKAPIWSIPQAQWDTSYWIDKPWTQYCQGCHTTGFEMKEKPAFAELGIGCEACHGPAGAHVESAGRVPVINPADLDPVRSDMICQSCHTTGHDRTGQFRFPLGYLPGKDLTRFYKGLLPKPGQDNKSFGGDESYEDRHRQWLFWVGSFMDVKGMTCDICKNFRGRLDSKEKVQMTPSEYCLSCHRDDWPGDSLHQDHLQNGVHCHRCHVPELAPGGKRFSIHDHKFLFLEPEVAAAVPPREACGYCHPDGVPLERDKP